MLTPVYTRQFDRDVKRMTRRGKDLDKLKIIIRSLLREGQLDPIHRDHKLIGHWQGRRECHIEPIKRAHSPQLAAGLASVYKMSNIPYGRRFPAACCRVFNLTGF